jgi:hypothetical protein
MLKSLGCAQTKLPKNKKGNIKRALEINLLIFIILDLKSTKRII